MTAGRARAAAPGTPATSSGAVGTGASRRSGAAQTARRSGLEARNHARLSATFSPRLRSGRCTVSWRARADDGHSESGTFGFRVR